MYLSLKVFKKFIRKFNSSFAFGSLGARINVVHGSSAQFLSLQGQTYHNASALYPLNNASPRYAQLYIVDTEIAQQQRRELFNQSEANYLPNQIEWPIIQDVNNNKFSIL